MTSDGSAGTYQSESVFPYICDLANFSTLSSLDATLQHLETTRTQYLDGARRHGAVLFRNTRANTAADFDALIRCFHLPNFSYENSLSNAVRLVKTERVFTANEAPAEAGIFLHHEMAQTPIYPSRIFFFCETPADSGGATPICRSDHLVARLEKEMPQFIEACSVKGLRYTHTMPDEDNPESGMGRSWRSTFRADTRANCEENMKRLGYTGVWNADGSLTATTPVLSGVKTLEDGRRVFFNQLIAAYSGFASAGKNADDAIAFGDGEKLPAECVLRACEIAEELTYDIPWQSGDLALVDNYVTMHGRRRFQGTRRILASLIA